MSLPAERTVAAPSWPPVPAYAAALADGREVLIRSATLRDLAGILDFFERLGPASRYSRFFSPQPRLRRAMIERVVAPGPDRLSLVAQPAAFVETSRHVVAVGSWVHVPADDRAEISIAVADDWQGASLGTYVVLVLLRTAVDCGHGRFAAEVLGTNARMLGLLRDLGTPMRTSCAAGVLRLEFELPEALAEADGGAIPVFENATCGTSQ